MPPKKATRKSNAAIYVVVVIALAGVAAGALYGLGFFGKEKKSDKDKKAKESITAKKEDPKKPTTIKPTASAGVGIEPVVPLEIPPAGSLPGGASGASRFPSAGSSSVHPADEGLTRTAKIYEGMQSEEVVSVLSKLSDAEVLSLFAKMSDRSVGKILVALPPERAAKLTKTMMRSP